MSLKMPCAFPSEIRAFLSVPELNADRQKHPDKYLGQRNKLSSPPPTWVDVQEKPHHSPHQVFVLGLQDVVGNRGVQAARPAGWIFFAGEGEGKTVIGRLSHRAPSRMTAVYHDKRVWQLLKQSRDLNDLEPVKKEHYEPRLLTIPGLNLMVFWLVALDPKSSDLVVPVKAYPAPKDYTALYQGHYNDPWWEMPHFLALIRPRAAKVLQAPASHVG